jgi:4-amino-4-deoxy-L-arabinose transferase-like glycosyltransferase
LLIFIAKQTFNVIVFPPFTGHDEVAHFAYIRTVADEHRIPIIPDLDEWRVAWQNRATLPGDYLPDDLYKKYSRHALDWCCVDNPRFSEQPAPGMSLPNPQDPQKPLLFPNGWQYAANHPPLYYAIMAPLYAATQSFSIESQQYVIRAAAIPFGVLTILLTYLMAGLVFPRDRLMSMVAPTFVAFQTQVSYEAAMINNDILLIAMFTFLLYVLVRGVRRGFTLQSSAVVGLALGLGLLAKASMLSAVPLVMIAMVFGIGVRQVRRWVSLGAVAAGVMALASWPWYAFLYRTYGNWNGLEQVKDLQYRWTYQFSDSPSILDQLWNSGFADARWKETWGEFGWRRIHLDTWLLVAIGIPLLIMAVAALASLAVASWRRMSTSPVGYAALRREQVLALWLLLAACVVAYGAMLQFGTTFALTQARYYFNAVGAVAILLAFGLRQITPVRYHSAAIVTFLLVMVSINLLIYTQSVLPYWYLAS